jgi:phosphatidyl-myo-inositol alpha-mannosyltransferase
MKVGIVVPFSWSYWGGVVEHAENQVRALADLGHEPKLIIGNDPPGRLTRLLHPRYGRHAPLPNYVIPVGRTVIVPANGSLSNICLTPQAMPRMKRVFVRERFDILHIHEPLAPILCQYALAYHPCPVVATAHSSGGHFYRIGRLFWSRLAERIDYRIAVSEQARSAAEPNIGGPFEILPNGVGLPPQTDSGNRENHVVFIGRHEPRKGLHVLLRAWPTVARQTGARLRLIGADPLSARLLLRRLGIPEKEHRIDILGVVPTETLVRELLQARVLAAPATGAESFGMVITQAFAATTPVVASDIAGYREVANADTGILVPPGDPDALGQALTSLLEDEPRRRELGERARRVAEEQYSWERIAARLVEIYGSLVEVPAAERVAA